MFLKHQPGSGKVLFWQATLCLFLFLEPCCASFTYQKYINQGMQAAYPHIRINQTDGKCYDRSLIGSCARYCRSEFAYVPNVLSNNMEDYDPITHQCKSRLYCDIRDANIYYNKNRNGCINTLYNRTQPPLNVTRPTQAQLMAYYKLMTFKCFHGYLANTTHLFCACNPGWRSSFRSGLGLIYQCDWPNKIQSFLPVVYAPYYNLTDDSPWPEAWQSDYYAQVLSFCVRRAKYYIREFFYPHQIALAMFLIPAKEPLITPLEYPYVTYFCLFSAFVVILTIRQRIRQYLFEEIIG